MKTVVKTATATTERGTVINLRVTVTRGWEKVIEHLYNDGWESAVEKMKVTEKTDVVSVVNGNSYKGDFETGIFVPGDYKKQGVFAILGNKIGVSERVFNELSPVIESAITEAETDETWMAYVSRKAQAEKEEEEYYKHLKGVENMMTLKGRTY